TWFRLRLPRRGRNRALGRQHLNLIARQRSSQIRQSPAALKYFRRAFVDIVHQKNAVCQTGDDALHFATIELRACSTQSIQKTRLVTLGLQSSDEPRSRV